MERPGEGAVPLALAWTHDVLDQPKHDTFRMPVEAKALDVGKVVTTDGEASGVAGNKARRTADWSRVSVWALQILAFVPCMFYTEAMPNTSRRTRPKASLTLKLGDWLEAHATGWGIAAIPIVVGLVLLAAAFRVSSA